jgi:hypothetical protein
MGSLKSAIYSLMLSVILFGMQDSPDDKHHSQSCR